MYLIVEEDVRDFWSFCIRPYREPKERILRSNRLSTALHVGNINNAHVSSVQCQGLL